MTTDPAGPAAPPAVDPPLAGVRILDLTHMLAGPYATMLLADLGAEIIKVEPPGGEFIRGAGPTFGDGEEAFGGYFHSVNRNKRSLPLNLRDPEGRRIFLEFVDSADAVIENFRVGIMESLALDWEVLHARNPRLVYGCIRGFGDPRTGMSPYVNWPAYDVVAQAMGGFMHVNGFPEREPVKSGIGIGDLFPAALLDIGVLSAILQARATGQGRLVDVGMYDAMISLAERNAYQHSITGEVPGRIGNSHPLFAPFGLFEAKDGWVTIAAPSNREWTVFASLIGHPELIDDPRSSQPTARHENIEFVNDVIQEWTRTRTKAEIVNELGGRVPVGPVQTARDIAADPHVAIRQMLVEVEQPGTGHVVSIAGTPIRFSPASSVGIRRAPLLGEDTVSLLAEIGIDQQAVQGLVASGIVATTADATSAATHA
ncbi:CoA transferase [Microbacterium soli]|uniref:CoA transferase n=1 Tax=Microbacterium soli TaxID=446075 RepID=A0ABP7MV55_9MICO